MQNITLKQMRYFEALAQHGHFGHAAEACSISQPALSMQIKELEQSLGMPLFERSAKQVRLTSFGQAFALRVRDIVRQVDDLGNLAQSSRNSIVGPLRLGVIPTIAPYLLPKLVANLKEKHGKLDLRLRETLTPRLIQELSDGRLDAAIVALPVSESAFEEVALFEESFILVRPAADANLPVPSAAKLREMRLLLLEEGHCFRDQALSFCNMPTAQPRELLDGSSLSTLVQMVGAGVGVTLVPEMAVSVETRSAQVTLQRFKAPGPKRTVGMIWRKTSPLSAQLGEIAEIVRTTSQEIAPSSTT